MSATTLNEVAAELQKLIEDIDEGGNTQIGVSRATLADWLDGISAHLGRIALCAIEMREVIDRHNSEHGQAAPYLSTKVDAGLIEDWFHAYYQGVARRLL